MHLHVENIRIHYEPTRDRQERIMNALRRRFINAYTVIVDIVLKSSIVRYNHQKKSPTVLYSIQLHNVSRKAAFFIKYV